LRVLRRHVQRDAFPRGGASPLLSLLSRVRSFHVIKSKLSGDAYRFGRVRDKSGIAEIFIGGSRKFPNIVLPMELRRMRAESQLRFHWLRSFDGCNYLVPHLSERCHTYS
jgi:hypothetical protein